MEKKKKILIITGILESESLARSNQDLEADIKRRLDPKDIPWVERIEKIKVLSS